jgi:hypothetical protein
MGGVGLHAFGRNGPQFPRQVDFRPSRLGDLALALAGVREKPE